MGGLIKLIVIVALVGGFVKYYVLGEKSHRDQVVAAAVRQINEKSGQMVDKETLVKGAYESSVGLVINYQLIDFQEVAFDRAKLNKELLKNAKSKLCGKREITEVLDLDIAVNYVYFNATDKKIAEIRLDKNTCR